MDDQIGFTDVVRESIGNAVVCWLATVDEDGGPNVSPKQLFSCHDDVVVIADIPSGGSILNISARPRICLGFIDVFRQAGYRIAATADVLEPGAPDFDRHATELKRFVGDGRWRHSIIVARPARISAIPTPCLTSHPPRLRRDRLEEAYMGGIIGGV